MRARRSTVVSVAAVFAMALVTAWSPRDAAAEESRCWHFNTGTMIYELLRCGPDARVRFDAQNAQPPPRPAAVRRDASGRRCGMLDPRTGLVVICFDEESPARERPSPAPPRTHDASGRRCGGLDPRTGLMIVCFEGDRGR